MPCTIIAKTAPQYPEGGSGQFKEKIKKAGEGIKKVNTPRKNSQ